MSMNEKDTMDSHFDLLRQELPPIFTRQVVCQHLGGLLSAATLANLDSAGQGPPRITLGKKVAYARDDFLNWLVGRTHCQDDTKK